MSEKELFKLIVRLSTVIETLEDLWKCDTLNQAQSLVLLMLYGQREAARVAYKELAESEAGV